jgi:Bifunctional DNA primase/polymerase, N-terminal
VSNILKLIAPALLIPWKWGTKATKKRWQHLTANAMNEPAYLAELSKKVNIGVVLGARSAGLCSIDIDRDDLAQKFLSLPLWSQTLLTRGARGFNAWFRFPEKYPPSQHIKTITGVDIGEFRADGNQTIIYGRHPAGMLYTIVNAVPVMEIVWDELPWPVEVIRPTFKRAAVTANEYTEETEVSEDIEETDGLEVVSNRILVDIKDIDILVASCLPDTTGTNNKKLFRLAK